MRRADVRKGGEQVCVRPYVVSRHLPICKNGKKDINSVISKCPSVGGIARGLAGIKREEVRQQNSRRTLCSLRCIATRVLQRVREDRDKTSIVRRLRSLVGGLLIARKEYRLRSQRAAVRLNPFPARAVHSAMPQAHLSGAQGGIRHFQNDAAHVLVGKEIVTGELQIVQRPHRVKAKGVAAPAREESVVSGRGYVCLVCGRDRCPFYDCLPVAASARSLLALNAAQCCSLGSFLV